jgi:hypothetical protein
MRLRARLALAYLRSPERLRWVAHRLAVRKTGVPIPLHRGGETRVLVLSHDNRIAESQLFPLFYYRRQLAQRYGISLREQDIVAFQAREGSAPESIARADVVLLQPWFDVGAERIQHLLDDVVCRCRPQRIVFMDSYAPTDLRFAEVLTDRIDLYVKKHVLRDRRQYGRTTYGDTNLTDYYCRLYACERSQVTFAVPPAFLDKLMVGPSFFTSDYMLDAFRAAAPRRSPALYDVHARLGRAGDDWYQAMRNDALRRLEAIGGLRTVPGFGVSREAFLE